MTSLKSPSVVRLRKRTEDLGIPQAYIAALCDVSQAKLSRAFAGLEPMSSSAEQKLDSVLRTLEHLKEIFDRVQIPLDLRQIDKVQELMSQLERGDLAQILILPAAKSGSDLLNEVKNMNAVVQGA